MIRIHTGQCHCQLTWGYYQRYRGVGEERLGMLCYKVAMVDWCAITLLWTQLCHNQGCVFSAALAALYLTLVSQWVTATLEFKTFETWEPSDIWSAWYLDKMTKKDKKYKKTEGQNYKKNGKKTTWQKRQNDKTAKIRKDHMTKRQKGEKIKTKRQRPKGEFNSVTSRQFCTLAMLFL